MSCNNDPPGRLRILRSNHIYKLPLPYGGMILKFILLDVPVESLQSRDNVIPNKGIILRLGYVQ